MATISTGPEPIIKLDVYDKKLIYYLSQNSREPISQLSKKLGISPQRTAYKIDHLKNTILEPAAFLNYSVLDIPAYLIFLKQASQETIDGLISSKHIYFLMQNIGEYEWILNVVTEDIQDFCKTYLSSSLYEIQPILRSIPDKFDPFQLRIAETPLRETKPLDLKPIDYRILSAVSQHPSDSLMNLSIQANVDRSTLNKKLQAYVENNLIQKFRYSINIFKLGHIAYMLRITTTPKELESVIASARENSYSGFIFASYNSFTMHYLPSSHNDLTLFLKQLRTQFSQIHIEVVQNTEFFKVQLVPPIVQEIFERRSND